jgi:hypothetical protein
LLNMPTALTMLQSYRRQVSASRGAGLAGLEEQARLSPAIRALTRLVDDDYDPRGSSTTSGISRDVRAW